MSGQDVWSQSETSFCIYLCKHLDQNILNTDWAERKADRGREERKQIITETWRRAQQLSLACASVWCMCTGRYRYTSCRLQFNPLPDRVKWSLSCVEFPSEGTSVFKSAGSRDAAERKWMQTVAMQSLLRAERPQCGNNRVRGQ